MGPTSRFAAGALALVVLCAVPTPAPAGAVGEPLPFIGDDASYPPGVPPALTWPERAAVSYDGDPAVPGVPDDPEKIEGLPPVAPAFPHVEKLLEPFGVRPRDGDALVDVPEGHAEGQRIRRLLYAVHTAYARSARVTITVVRDEATLAHIETTTRMGALVLEDHREDATWPAGIYLEPVIVTPKPVNFRIGPRIAFSLMPVDDDRLVLDLDLHVSANRGERTFEDAARRVVPIIGFTHLRAAIPVTRNAQTVATLGDVTVRALVTWEPQRAIEGVRTLWLPAPNGGLPRAERMTPAARALVEEDEPAWDAFERMRALPEAWQTIAETAGVRLVAVPPGVAIAEGEEEALRRFDAALTRERRKHAQVVREPVSGLALPFVAGTRWTFVDGEVVPVGAEVDLEIQWERVAVGLEVTVEPTGVFAHGASTEDSLGLTVDTRRMNVRSLPLTVRIKDLGGVPDRLPLDRARSSTTTRTLSLGGDVGPTEGATLAPLDGWR